MRKIKAGELTKEAFEPYGSYVSITNPSGHCMGTFYNDKILYHVSGDMPIGFSPLVCEKEEKMIVTKAEYHNTTGEGIVVMDDDVILHVAPPSGEPCPELTEAFIVPKGTMVALKTGVWHMGVMPVHNEKVHVLIVLPERIYKNDCHVVQYDEQEQIEIVL